MNSSNIDSVLCKTKMHGSLNIIPHKPDSLKTIVLQKLQLRKKVDVLIT